MAQQAVTVVLGQVTSAKPPPQRSEPTEDAEGVVFEDWSVEVERYIINPQPFTRIEVRVFTAALLRAGEPEVTTPLKEPGLDVGERVLLFLNKREVNNARLAEDEFTMLGPYISGKLLVQDGKAKLQYGLGSPSDVRPWEPLDEIIAAMTSPLTPTLIPTPTPTALPPSAGIHTPEDLRHFLDGWPEDAKLVINEDVVVHFCSLDPTRQGYCRGYGVWPARIYHIPSMSVVYLGVGGEVVSGGRSRDNPEGSGKVYKSEEGAAALEAVLADGALMEHIRARIQNIWR